MFGFLFRKKREEVRRLLSGRMNRSVLSEFRYGNRRDPRGSFCEVVWAVPCDDGDSTPRIERAFPVVTRDISPGGLSVIHTRRFPASHTLIGLPGADGPTFLSCDVQHTTPLGCGFFQTGLCSSEIAHVDPAMVESLNRRFAEFDRETRPADEPARSGDEKATAALTAN